MSVVIVSYRTPDLTVRAVRSVLEAGVDQVVVVDNASGDTTLDLLRREGGAKVEVMPRSGNDGFGTAANAGAGAAAGSVLVFLNSDGKLSAPAANFAVGREAFLELGGFDEQFFLYFEDIDLCRRARAAGFAIRYLPEAVVPHIGGASSADDYHFGPAHARSMRQYLAKWYGPGGAVFAVLLLWLRAVGFTVSLRPRAGRAWRSLWAALRPGAGAP